MTMVNMSNPVAEAMYEAASRYRNEQGQRKYLGMSGIGGWCARKIWYGFRGYTPSEMEGRVQMIFSLGSAVEEEVLKWLRKGGYQIDGQQDEFSALNGFFRGHCDGVIHGVFQHPAVLEIKSASASRFQAFREGTIAKVSPEYYAQVQCYMAYSGLTTALWVVMNKNTCEIYTETCHFEEEQFQRIEDRARNIITGAMPDRSFAEHSRECNMCEYRGHCWTAPYVQTAKTCGTCGSCEFHGLDPWCLTHSVTIKRWGISCPDWQFRDDTDQVPF